MTRWAIPCIAVFFIAHAAVASEPIRLANNPSLSPDGNQLAFDWNGDVWIAPATGGEARPLTAHPGRDTQPRFAPDGKQIAFVSDRDGSPQVYTLSIHGGIPKQLTFHTAGAALQEWSPDGKSLLIKATRDNFWRHGERFFTIKGNERSAEKLLFDDYGNDGTLSRDGKKLLFTREGEGWWRKGYTGARVAQVWLYDFESKSFTKVLHRKYGSRWPIWNRDGTGFYYVAEHATGGNLAEYNFETKESKTLTTFKNNSVAFPTISRDGTRIVFRHQFDFYGYDTFKNEMKRLEFFHNVDRTIKKSEFRVLNTATAAAFYSDGLEIAFIAGGDLWVMDTELREPRQITKTAEEEGNPVFSADGQTIYFTRQTGPDHEIARVTRKNPKQHWWQQREFEVSLLVGFQQQPARLKLSPDGKKLGYIVERRGLYYVDLAVGELMPIQYDWSIADYDWSPDGKWVVYSKQDEDFNRDIWIVRADMGSKAKPFNLSRHPFTEHDPVWSPDGKMIAFAGRRATGDPGANVAVVSLQPADDEVTSRDRKLEKALDKMKARPGSDDASKPPAMKSGGAAIEFERLPERVKRVNLGEGFAGTLFWSPDSKKLVFTGNYEGKTGTFAIDIGDNLSPKAFNSTAGKDPVWLKKGNQITWLVGGVPTSTPGVASAAPADPAPAATTPKKGFTKGKTPGTTTQPAATGGGYTFSVRQHVDLPARNGIIFDQCWVTMRDHWYDSKLGNNDWDFIRTKYRDMAVRSPDNESLTTVVQMMLGELNGSHLGFTMAPAEAKPTAPRDTTAHLGVRFDPYYTGPGLKIRDILPGGPADKKRSALFAGEIIEKIDGIDVDSHMDLTLALNGPADREITLSTKLNGKQREVKLRPMQYVAAQALLYDHWLNHNRKLVADASKGKLGYLHISAMSMPNFRKFEEELVSQGAGKDGLVIDVRENPGGSITDHLLTALTQPNHAITVPRGGGPGYPLDRKVYISWHKPIVVLCNQNSGSNAEIFSHAIKTLKRGQVVGVPTAGAVVSTGAAQIMDAGILRLPTRGWFTIDDGEDMEKNGAVPHHVIWPAPTQLPQGSDGQLNKAIELLQADVQAWHDRPRPKLKLSTERP